MSPDHILDALAHLQEPQHRQTLAQMERIRDVRVEGDAVSVTLVLDDTDAPFARQAARRATLAIHEAVGTAVTVQVNLEQAYSDANLPTCRCGHTRASFWVSPEAQYPSFNYWSGVFLGLSMGHPKSIRFTCRKCGEVLEESTAEADILQYYQT
ncbi:MAG: iron-sulfur cluster assembly protein [Bacteroidota bacterium]